MVEDDRGLHYGDGLFETMAVAGGRIPLLERHLERLVRDAGRLGLRGLPGREVLAAELGELAAHDDHATCGVLKLVVTAGAGERGYRRPSEPAPLCMARLSARPGPPDAPGAPGAQGHGVRLRWCETPVSSNPALAGMKHLARLEQVLARDEWSEPGIWEGLMSDAEGRVIGGTMSNLFLVRGDRYLTPALDRSGVSGVMREWVLEESAAAGVEVAVTDVTRDDVLDADALFLTNAVQGVVPVSVLGDREFRADEWASRLRDRIRGILIPATGADG